MYVNFAMEKYRFKHKREDICLLHVNKHTVQGTWFYMLCVLSYHVSTSTGITKFGFELSTVLF